MARSKALANIPRLANWPSYVLWYATGKRVSVAPDLAVLVQEASVCPVLIAVMAQFYFNQDRCRTDPIPAVFDFDPVELVDSAVDEAQTEQRLVYLTDAALRFWYPRMLTDVSARDTLRALSPLRTRSDVETLLTRMLRYAPRTYGFQLSGYSQFSQLPAYHAADLVCNIISGVTSSIERYTRIWDNPHGHIQNFLSFSVWPTFVILLTMGRQKQRRLQFYPDQQF